MAHVNFVNFLKDLGKLSNRCNSVQLKRVFADASNQYVNSFYQWLIKNPGLKSNLSLPVVYDGLVNLRKIRQEMLKSPVPVPVTVNFLFEKTQKFGRYYDIIKSFKRFRDHVLFVDYVDIIDSAQNYASNFDIGEVESSINQLIDMFEDHETPNGSSSSIEDIKKFFIYALNAISEKAASGLISNGYNDAANSIVSNGILLDQHALSQELSGMQSNSIMRERASSIARKAMNYAGNGEVKDNIMNYILTEALSFTSSMSNDELGKFKPEPPDFSQLMKGNQQSENPEQTETETENDKGKVKSMSIINEVADDKFSSFYLVTMLSCILISMYQIIVSRSSNRF